MNPSYKATLTQKIQAALSPVYLLVLDETEKHAGHKGVSSGGGHFVVHMVSHRFEGVSPLNRNRIVFDLFKEEIGSVIHALSICAQTISEWESEKLTSLQTS